MQHNSSREDKQRRLEMAFDIFDINDDNKIDAKELQKLFVALGELQGQHADQSKQKAQDILSRYDVNHNKSLSKAEFVDALQHEQVFSHFH
jgi:Ca2+-binding EF-hand superfamily protein